MFGSEISKNLCPLSPSNFGKDANFSPTPRKSLHSRELLQCGKDRLPGYLEGFLFFTDFSFRLRTDRTVTSINDFF